MPTRIFIRDDDVGALTPAFRRFFRVFAERGVPVSYQIIPKRFTAECADFLLAERARSPGMVDFGQHGLSHEMVVNGKTEFYEFGPERTYDQQLADIKAGRALLRERLGEEVELKVFTPPRHRYDRNTLMAIRKAGYSVLSSSSYASVKHRIAYAVGRALGLTNLGRPGVAWHGRVRPDCGLYELSIAVGADDGGAINASVDSVIAGAAAARAHTDDVGLMFHHQAYGDDAGEAFLIELIARLQALPDVRFATIGRLYDEAQAARK